LFALVVGRGQVQVRLGNFDVIAENIVEANLQRLDAGSTPLTRLNLGDILPSVAAQVPELVQFGMKSVANGAAISQVDGRLVRNSGPNAVAHFCDLVHILMDASQTV